MTTNSDSECSYVANLADFNVMRVIKNNSNKVVYNNKKSIIVIVTVMMVIK